MNLTLQDCVAALVATCNRPDLLNTRALPSIAQQSQTPIRVVVVDDSDDADAAQTEAIVRDWRHGGSRIEYLPNRRTKKRAAGAWNTGLDHLLRTCDDPIRLFVAILDDDDEWVPDHLRRCLAAAETQRLDVVASGFWRIEEGAEPKLVTPPESLEASGFLVGNPGIQGSNLVCRLRVLLEAGLFDESLQSCTDRDLCIRLADLPDVYYGAVTEPTVRHFACASRARLSTPGSSAKKEGLDQFYRKWRCRMSDAVHAAFLARARDLFGWAAPEPKVPNIVTADGVSLSSAAPKQAPPHLIVGTIANPEQLEDVAGLLADLRKQVDDPDLSGHDVLILENGNCRKPDAALRNLVEDHRAAGLRVHLVDRARHLEDAAQGLVADGGVSKGKRLPIAPARTVLQSYLYAFAKGRPGAVMWIVDDDMRLNPLVAKDNGRLQRRPQKLAPMVRELRRLHAGGELDIAIGTNSGAPPLPFAATVRVQLVDLVASLQWLALLEPQAALPDRSLDNTVLRATRRDYYYDLSRKETDRLETPFVVTPAFPGESAGDTFTRLASAAERILAGEQVFRPLAIAAGIDPLASVDRGLQRGGNTFVFDVEALRLAPNPSPTIAGRPSRRSDMIWTLLQERYFGRRVFTLPIALHHDRSHVQPAELDVKRIVDDVRGYALFSALKDVGGIFTVSDDQHMELAQAKVQRFTIRVGKYLEERLAAFRLSFHRVRGLKRMLRQLVEDGEKWWREGRYEEARTRLRSFCECLDRCYKVDVLNRIEDGARALRPPQIREFLGQLPCEISAHRNRLSEYPALAAAIEPERTANAKAIASTLAAPVGLLTVLGHGMEGVALSDGKQVFKVFDYWWKSSSTVSAPAYLRTLVGKWKDAKCLYPILDFQEGGHRAVLVYPFEPSEPYTGGHGPGMVDLLAECWQHGVVCRNIHPDNLRVVDGRVRLIDYGSDIRPFAAGEFVTMCQRAWLSYRWANRPNLAQIMRRALKDDGIAELDGFDRFHEAVRRATGQHETPDVVFDWAREGGHVLDYGCGYGKLAGKLAECGGEVMGYDPDAALVGRWARLASGGDDLQFTHNRAEVLAAGRFDLVICARVLCTILDDGDFRTVLHDLRSLVTESGRVIVTVCDPHFTFGGLQAAETERTLPCDADYEHTFVWRKKLRATGRARCDVHRPERTLRRAFARAGLAVCRRVEIPTVDLQRFEPASEQLVFELRPVAPLPGKVSLLIKACAMDADALDVQIRHLVAQLEEPRAFAERILVVDAKEHEFLRQHTAGSQPDLLESARRLVEAGWLDRIVEAPGEGDATAALNRRWFALDTPHTHTAAGAHVTPLLAGFEACATPYVLHVDADIMVGRLGRQHDYLPDMLAVMRGDPQALTVAFNIAQQHDRRYTAELAENAAKPWRTESRAGLVDLARLHAALPLPNSLEVCRLALSWHRSLDIAIQGTSRGKPSAGRAYRGGDHRAFYTHPPNERKRDAAAWFAVLDRIEHGVVPPVQRGEVEWTGAIADWMLPRRPEPYVFVVSGRNVPAGRLRRCIASLVRQKGLPWGAVVFDDASAPAFAEPFEMAWRDIGARCTIIRNRRRQGLLANMVTAIRTICTDPNTVIVTLDADDALIGDEVLLRLTSEYENGADVTVGSMLRTDKAAEYPVRFHRPREHRGGNVWQHLRSFRKRLFDAIPDDALRLDGEYIDLANDWAYMLPIVEMASNPVHIADALYLHEPSGTGKDAAGRKLRDEVIARIVAKAPAAQRLQTRAGTL